MQNRILVGSIDNPAAEFTPDAIDEIRGKLASAIIGDQLSVDTIEPIVGNAIIAYMAFEPSDDDGLITADDEEFYCADAEELLPGEVLQDGTAIYWFHGDALKGKFFVRDVLRTGRTRYQIEAVSAVGLLDGYQHRGGIYTGQTVADVLDEIIGDTFVYSVTDEAGAQRVYGWLPYDVARQNLHKVMLALGIALTKDAAGDVVFGFPAAGAPTIVPADRVYIGGSVGRAEVASRIEVTEHNFIAALDGENIVAFDNTDGSQTADEQTVIFADAPLHSLTASGGLTIHNSGANWATVSGTGTLTGTKYIHTAQILAADNAAARRENVKRLAADALVNPINSRNVLARLLSYYTSSETISADIRITTELPSQRLTLTDAFGDLRTAWLQSMEFRATTLMRASATLVAGYMPGAAGNLYDTVHRITADGSWTVPAGVSEVLIVLIGGGSGGSGGYDGHDGHGGTPNYGGDMTLYDGGAYQAYYYKDGMPTAGAGGEPGEPGLAGHVYAFALALSAGDVLTFVVGNGGSGGARNGGAGLPGTQTTVTAGGAEYSSDMGAITSGTLELISGAVFGQPGAAGQRGGDGGITTITDNRGWDSGDGADGQTVGSYAGGAGGAGEYMERTATITYESAGGGGGGAAYGSDGSAGGDGHVYIESYGEVATGGSGGYGADASAPEPAGYGGGGNAGHGGGGGGNAGGARYSDPGITEDELFVDAGLPGRGGHGSVGGDGGDGIALVYYKAVS